MGHILLFDRMACLYIYSNITNMESRKKHFTIIFWISRREDSSSWQIDKQNTVGRQFLEIRAMKQAVREPYMYFKCINSKKKFYTSFISLFLLT